MKSHQGGTLVHYTCASRMIEAVLVQNNQEGIWKESRPKILVYIYIYMCVVCSHPGNISICSTVLEILNI